MALSKREIIAETIEAGGATMEKLMEAADCKYESVMSNFSMLRLMGKCPVKDVEVDGEMTYRFVTSEEWEEIKAEKAANAGTKRTASAKSPAERLVAAEKRIDRCTKAAENAQKRADDNKVEDAQELLDLRAQKADIDRQIAQIELDTAQALVDEDEDAKAEYEQLTAPAEEAEEAEEVEGDDDVDFDD